MKTLIAALMLATLAACSAVDAGAAAQAEPRPAAGKPLPYAPPPPPMQEEGIVCPADVQQCPDGSFVSRNPDQGCAFAPCPGASKP